MIKNCIFDFGNVLAVFDPDKLTAPYFSDAALRREISGVVFDRIYWDKLDNGTISDEEVKEGIRSRVDAEYADRACAVYDDWVKNLEPFEGMTEAVKYIRSRGIRLYLLSNISMGFASQYKNVKWIKDLFDMFEGLVFSAETRLVKPDGEIFRYILDKFGLERDECIFVDDSPANISGAESVGIRGVLFKGDASVLLKLFE